MKDKYWDSVITPKVPLIDLRLQEVLNYRDLLYMFVKRDIAQFYKQTVLGPLWFFIQPLLTTIVFTVVFGGMVGIKTDGIPPMLFYLAGITFWNFFSESLNKCATVYKDHQHVFGKVYFPRMVVPLSIVATNMLKLCVQFLLFIVVYIIFIFKGMPIEINGIALLFPILILLTGALGLGLGLMVTAATTKYRDLNFLVTFGVQLIMYITPIIYPLSKVPEKYQIFALINPLTGIVETFKYGFLGGETVFSWMYLLYSTVSTIICLLIGINFFNRTERNFIDVI
ncbi:MAG: ABC transporter permease [Saprospiraceae bacterium]